MTTDIRVQDDYNTKSKRIKAKLMQSQQAVTMNASSKDLVSFDTITSLCGVNKNVFNTNDIQYYRITINQLLSSINSNTKETIHKIARRLNIEDKDVIQSRFYVSKMADLMQVYFLLYRAELSDESNEEAFKEYKYKLLCIFKSLNKHGILVEETQRLLTMSFLVPKDIDKDTALQIIFDLFKEYGIYDTIWRVHILPLNEFRRVFMNYTDNKTIYLKEIA